MIHFLDLAKNRFSARSYLSVPVEDEKLNYVLEAARVAPSAVNKQPFKIFVFKEGVIRDKINETYHREWMRTAPVLLLICADHQAAWQHAKLDYDASIIDASIAIDHMTLAATDIGLATCWICNFDMEKCKEILLLKDNIEPVALLPLGYTNVKQDPDRHTNVRKKMDEIVKFVE